MHRTARLMRLAAGAALVASLLVAPAPTLAAQRLGSRVLREGMSGADVRALQQLLTEAGFSTPVSGYFGATTERSVVAFENAFGLPPNGVVTRAVVAQLRSVIAGSGGASPTVVAAGPAFAAPRLSEGARGHWVTVLQRQLTLVGYPTPLDGSFGPATAHSVVAFKRSEGLAANAVMGPMAWAALEAAVAQVESTPPTGRARLNADGLAIAPADAPRAVKEVIAAANRIAHLPYCYAGGHGRWVDSCYDCSGSVGYALHGAGLLSVTEDSGQMESYGSPGYGRWITLFANAGHVYMLVAGLWFDTAAQSSANGEDRWSKSRISPAAGFVARHPTGL